MSVVFVELSPVGLACRPTPRTFARLSVEPLAKRSARWRRSGARWRRSRGRACRFSSAPRRRTRTTLKRAPRRAAVGKCCRRLQPATLITAFVGPEDGRPVRLPFRACRGRVGTAVAGPVGGVGRGAATGRSARSVGAAAALQSAARPGSVLVGAATRRATEGIFEWGPSQDVPVSPG